MYTRIAQKMKRDPYIERALAEKQKHARKTFLICAAVVWVFSLLLCALAEFEALGWAATLLCALCLTILLFWLVCHRKKKPKIFLGTVTRMEEDRKTVPQKGTGAFGRLPSYQYETYDLLVAITDGSGATQVIFCPAQYEKILKLGDTLLCHPILPYPAHLSNPTTCICMHCGTTQAADESRCTACGANLYNVYTMRK